MSDEAINETPAMENEPPSLDVNPALPTEEEETTPVPPNVLDADALEALVEETHKESDAAQRRIALLEEELTLLCRRAIITTRERQWILCEGELHALTEQLNELRYESALLPIVQSVCPAAADPSNKKDMKDFCRRQLSPVREWRTSYCKGQPITDYSRPDWLSRSEKEAIWNAYMLPNAVRDRIAQLGMRCQDAREMLNRFRGLARQLTKASKP